MKMKIIRAQRSGRRTTQNLGMRVHVLTDIVWRVTGEREGGRGGGLRNGDAITVSMTEGG